MKFIKWSYASLLCAGLTSSFTNTNAQEKVKPFAVKEFYLLTGNTFTNYNAIQREDFEKLFPQSTILKSNPSGYNATNYSTNTKLPKLSMLLGLQLRDKGKTGYRSNPTLRIGVTSTAGANFSYSSNKKDIIRYDTLVSNKTGNSYYIDSIHTSDYIMNYRGSNLLLDVALVYRTSLHPRWSLYSGVGIAAGFSVNAKGTISKSDYGYVVNPQNSSSQPYGSVYEMETFKAPNNSIFSAYVPLGIDFKIAKKNEFFNKINAFYEAQPTYILSTINNFGSMQYLNILQNVGLRFNL